MDQLGTDRRFARSGDAPNTSQAACIRQSLSFIGECSKLEPISEQRFRGGWHRADLEDRDFAADCHIKFVICLFEKSLFHVSCEQERFSKARSLGVRLGLVRQLSPKITNYNQIFLPVLTCL
ncbi:hypothetical protein [Mesorhizobium sp. IMUNJ 23232]|uniref:hypothetical protein n=1 Tax=Mesorhizobium sp. IMUNJ 23232 TaxID=3376064 RepID=UPI00379DE6C0